MPAEASTPKKGFFKSLFYAAAGLATMAAVGVGLFFAWPIVAGAAVTVPLVGLTVGGTTLAAIATGVGGFLGGLLGLKFFQKSAETAPSVFSSAKSGGAAAPVKEEAKAHERAPEKAPTAERPKDPAITASPAQPAVSNTALTQATADSKKLEVVR